MLPSVSGLPRAFRCRASLLLPRIDRGSGAYAHKGHQVHGFLETAGKIGRADALAAVTDPDARALCEALELERLPLGDGVSWAAEVAYSLNLTTGEAQEVGRGIGRNYPQDGGLHGTADLVALSADGETAIILDAKTGRGWIPPAAESEQLKALALMACRAHGASKARIGHLHLREDGSEWTDWAEMDAFDLDAFAASLRMLAATTRGEPAEGPWCRYCPSLAHCPAKAKLAVALGSGVPFADSALTPELLPTVWARIKMARQLLDEVEAKVKEMALDHPVTLADGQVLGPDSDERDEIDSDKAADVLRDVYGQNAAVAIQPTVTKKSIELLARLRKEREGVTVKDAKAEALELLRKHGAVTVRRKTVVREHRPRE